MKFSRIKKGNDTFSLGLPHWDVPIGYELILPEGRQKYFTFLIISMRLVKSELLVLGTHTTSESRTGKSVPYDQVTVSL